MWVIKRAFWLTYWLLILVSVLLAGIVMASKLVLPMVDRYRPKIEQNLSQLTGFPVHVQSVNAELNGIDIKLAAANISVDTPGHQAALSIGNLEFELDLTRTLLTLSPQFQDFVVSEVDVSLEENGQGNVSLAGLAPTEKSSSDTDVAVSRVLNYVTEQRQISIVDANVSLISPRFDEQSIHLPHSYLFREHSKTLLSTDLYLNELEAPIGVRVQIENGITSFLKKYADIYIQVPEIEMPTAWLKVDALKDVSSVALAGEYWVRYRPGNGFDIQGRNSQVGMLFRDESRTGFSADWRLNNKGGLNAFNVSRLEFTEQNDTDAITQIRGEFDVQAKRSFVAYNYLDAKTISDLALRFVPSDWFLSRLLEGLDATGTAENGSIRVWQGKDQIRYQVSTNLIDATVKGFNGIPAVSNVDGIFSLTESGGGVEFLASDTMLAFPTLYDAPWAIEKASGEVLWRRVQDSFVVSGEDLSVRYAGSDIAGEFRLEQPEGREGWLALDINAQNVATENRLTFVPPNALSEGLTNWLQTSLSGGQARNVDVLVRASLEQGQAPLVRLNIDADVDEVTFDPQWPAANNVSANVYLGQSEVLVDVTQGQLSGLPIDELTVSVPLTSNGASWVNIAGRVENDANLVLDSLATTPLKDQVLSPFEEWQVEGDVSGQFDVYVPLNVEQGDPLVDLSLKFGAGDLYIPEIDLSTHLISGQLSFNSKTGLRDSLFHVEALGGKSDIVLTSEQLSDGRLVIKGDVKGDVSSKELASWRSLPDAFARRLSGSTEYQSQFSINKSQSGQVDVKVSSDLQGVAAQFPAPFAKASAMTLPFLLDLKVYQGEVLLNFDAENLLYGSLLLNAGEIKSGRFSLFKELPKEDQMQQGVALYGQTETFSWRDWSPLFDELAQSNVKDESSNESGSGPTPISLAVPDWISGLDILVDEVPINDSNQLNNVKLVYSKYQDGSPLTLTSDELNLVLRNAATLPSLHIAYLNWRTSGDKGDQESGEDAFKPGLIPTMNVRLDQLIIDNRPYGDWAGKVVNLGENVRIENITTKLEQGSFNGAVFWQGGESPNVEVSIDAKGSDTRELTRKFSSTPFIQSKSYNLNVVLSWSGSIVEFDRETLNGRINFRIQDGNFNQVDQLPVFLRVLGIFNIDSLLKRLTFDFSDLYEEGMSFDDFSSSLVIQDGILNTDKPVEVKAPTAEIRLNGTANLVDETLDERLTATIPISSTLPLAGLLLATPQVAGLLYITDKLIGDQISKVTSIQYEIKGPFNSPEVTPVKYNPRR